MRRRMRRPPPSCRTRCTCTATCFGASGRIDQAVAAFEAADRLEARILQDRERCRAEHEWHYEHNLDLLASSYRYQGQMSKAEGLLKTAFGVPSSLVVQMVNKHEWPAFLTSRDGTTEALAAAAVLVGASRPAWCARRATSRPATRSWRPGRFQAAADAAMNAALRELKAAPVGAALVGPSFEALQGAFFVRTNQREKGTGHVAERGRANAPGAGAGCLGADALSRSSRWRASLARPVIGRPRPGPRARWPRTTRTTPGPSTPRA